MRLSLVIPCFNEAANLPQLAGRCERVLASDRVEEVILIDNGSIDDSPIILERLAVANSRLRSIRVPINQGYGHGVLQGLAAARGDILGWTHADMQTDPVDALAGLELFATDPAPERLYVKGRRRGRPASDRAFTLAMSAFETLLLGRVLTDINAQPNMFHRSFFETWMDPPKDFSLDLYAYHAAKQAGLRVRRFPVTFGERAFGVSHWNVDWRGKAKFIRRTLDFSFRLRRGRNSP